MSDSRRCTVVVETRALPCARCDAPTVEIALLGGDDAVTMRSCSRCDHRSWSRAGRPARLHDVLDSVAATGRRRQSA